MAPPISTFSVDSLEVQNFMSSLKLLGDSSLPIYPYTGADVSKSVAHGVVVVPAHGECTVIFTTPDCSFSFLSKFTVDGSLQDQVIVVDKKIYTQQEWTRKTEVTGRFVFGRGETLLRHDFYEYNVTSIIQRPTLLSPHSPLDRIQFGPGIVEGSLMSPTPLATFIYRCKSLDNIISGFSTHPGSMHSVSLDPKTQGRCPRREYDARHTDTRDHIVIRSNYTPQSVLSFHDQRVIDELPVRLDLEAEAMKEVGSRPLHSEFYLNSANHLAPVDDASRTEDQARRLPQTRWTQFPPRVRRIMATHG